MTFLDDLNLIEDFELKESRMGRHNVNTKFDNSGTTRPDTY